MKIGRLLDSYIRMRNSQCRKNWREEVVLTIKFVTLFEKSSEKTQLYFLEYMFDNNFYQKGIITLLSESQCKE